MSIRSSRRILPVRGAGFFTVAAALFLPFQSGHPGHRGLHAFQDGEKPPVKEQGTEPAGKTEPAKVPEAKAEWKGDPYLLDFDPVTKLKLGTVETQWKILHRGREFRFANKELSDRFAADPSKFIPAVDARLIRDQSDFYPLETCLVSGEKLGEQAVSLVHRNRLVRFSSQAHVSTFMADTAKYIAVLDQAVIAKQGDGYAKTTCAVCAKPIGGAAGAPIDFVIGNRLIRVCSATCSTEIERDPRNYMWWYPDKEHRTRSLETPPAGDGPR